MIRRNAPDKNLIAGWAALVLVGVLLGFRSYTVASAVLSARPAGERPAPVIGGTVSDTTGAEEAADARAKACDRNPFRAPSSTEAVSAGARASVEERPALRALLYDEVAPSVQLSVADSIFSGWLRQGDQFKGWTVSKIERSSVTVSKAGRSIVLSSP